MKKIAILTVLVLICVSTSQAQRKADPSKAALSKFNEQFKGATDVRWTQKDGILGVSFNYRKDFSIAYFSEEGDLIARGRNIPEAQLPITVQDDLIKLKGQSEKKYGDFAIATIYEFSRGGESEYIVRLSNEQMSMLLVSQGGRMSIREKTKSSSVAVNASLLAQLQSY